MKKLFGLVLCAVIVSSLLFQPASAQQNQANQERITLSPAVSRPELKAGETVSGTLTVINDGSTDYKFLLYARPFSVKGEQYDPNYTEVNERTEAYQWVQFDKTDLSLAAGARVKVGYTLKVPARAASGGHYAVLFAETQPPLSSANIARKKRVGSLLYMSVAGDIQRSGSLVDWTTKFLQTKSPLLTNARIKNDGNVHFQANLSANYTNIFGKKSFELNQQLLILPGTTRKVPVVWENSPYFGIFKAQGTISYLDKTEQLPSKYIVLLPYPIIIGFALVVLALIAAMVLRIHRRSGSRVHRRK